ncbi:hypothetical protein NP511_15445 [Natrinema thermotolerans]|uniref:Uncharacterized protein n=1 Tax=Natrinema thermotolerans TaxID=121872 RepID=A0AAF0PC37_9EURY|nr:hypothetical protein [Natrinema thermotolerans]QCC59786.1 hypothetical protein DVR14_14580 [Natrinema thermotolerans]WMT06774.1 hypothetical protein NP511_15445 [Natrinema thermotolerans]
MPQYPRRTLLGSIGTTMTVALAGNAVSATDGRSTNDVGSPAFDSLFDYFPASAESDSMAVVTRDLEQQRKANDPYGHMSTGSGFGIDPESISKQAFVYATDDDAFSMPIVVIAGDFELEDDGDIRETDGGVEYERREDNEMVAAVTETVVVAAENDERIGEALAANAGEAKRLLDAEPLLEEAFGLFDGEHADYTVQIGEGYQFPDFTDDAAIEYSARATTVLDPDTLEVNIGVAFADATEITDELVDTLTSELRYMALTGEPTVERDGSLVTITAERDLAAEREANDHESPGSLRPEEDIDLEDDQLEIEIGRGDPTPVEDLTLEVGGEEYDRDIWTNSHGTLEEGDTIVIDMDDVEPNLSITLTHDHAAGSSTSGTSILDRFEFEYDYDVDAGTPTVEYADEFPLEGERVSIAVYDERPWYHSPDEEVEPRTTAQPWSGTMRSGDGTTLEDIRPGDTVLVCWDGTTMEDSIAHFRAQPPGTVAFDYDFERKTLSATLELEDGERPADAYELLIDDEPAETQWADEADTVSSGATIEVDDVAAGSDVTVVWGDDDVRVSGTHPRPRIELEFDEDQGVIEHVGGDSVAASELTLRVMTEDGFSEIDLGEEIDGEFEQGDTVSVDADEIRYAMLSYDGTSGSIGHVVPSRE